MRAAVLSLLISLSASAAEPTLAEAQRVQLEALRAQVAGEIQLQAYDLLDELVYGWTQQPVFALDTPVVLADVSVPVGFGSGLEALVETHFAGLVVKNPRSRVQLVHCPQCTALIVHSGSKGTVVARGVDQPEALAAAGKTTGSKHALFLDFEAEGSELVLRARITSLEPALPIVYAKTLSSSTSSPSLLRTGDRLVSAEEARKGFIETLEGRGVMLLPLRIGIRMYAAPTDGSSPIGVPPFPWLQIGAEVGLTQARAWTGSFSLGFSWIPELQTSWLAHARLNRLLSGSSASLTRPDLYGFLGGSLINVHGPAAQLFGRELPTAEELLASQSADIEPATRFAAIQVGLELRVKNRIGVAAYLEHLPTMDDAQAIGNYLDLGLVRFHSLGVEVSFCF